MLRGSCPKPTVATQAVQTLEARTSFKRSNLRDTGMEHLALLAGTCRKSSTGCPGDTSLDLRLPIAILHAGRAVSCNGQNFPKPRKKTIAKLAAGDVGVKFARHTSGLQGTPEISAWCPRRQRRRQRRGLRRRGLRHVRLRASRMSHLPLNETCQLISWRQELAAMAAAARSFPFLKGTWATWAEAPLPLPPSLSPSPRGFCAQLGQLASLASGLRIPWNARIEPCAWPAFRVQRAGPRVQTSSNEFRKGKSRAEAHDKERTEC